MKLNNRLPALRCIVCGDRYGIIDHTLIPPQSFAAKVCMDCRHATGDALTARNRLAPWTVGQTIPPDALMLMPVDFCRQALTPPEPPQ